MNDSIGYLPSKLAIFRLRLAIFRLRESAKNGNSLVLWVVIQIVEKR